MANQVNSPWTDELKERVKLLWVDHSALQIAQELGKENYTFTRNAIIGVLHRLNLTAENKTERRAPRPPREKRSTANHQHVIRRIVRANGNSDKMRLMETREMVEGFKLRCVEIVPRNLSLIDIEPGDCRYPYGDETITFCGHPKQEGSQYCTPHHHLCWVKPTSNAPKARVYHGTDFSRGAA